jgi:hypothetical protein
VTFAFVGWMLTLVGWIVSHVLTIRAQRQQFLNTVLDAGRKDVVRAIRRQQAWLSDVGSGLMGLEFVQLREEHGGGGPLLWLETSEKLRRKLFSEHGDLSQALEEYENLFPQTVVCRVELGQRLIQFLQATNQIVSELFDQNLRQEAIGRARELSLSDRLDLAALLEDLRVFIQNDTLGKITGLKVAHRRVREERAPRLLPDPDGVLRVQQ